MKSNNTILLCGDFNVNSSTYMHSELVSMMEECKADPEKYRSLLPLMENEYLYMMNSFTKEKKWRVRDLSRESSKGGKGTHNPITFGDYTVVDGENVPTDKILCSS